DILDLSKIEAGKIEIENEPMRLDRVVHEIKQIFHSKISAKNLVITATIDDNLPPFLALDEVRIHQILFNLVGNAVKFTEKGFVKLNISGKTSRDKKRVNLTIRVEDTGIGIPEAQQEDIFLSFTQQSGQSTRKYGGTGLGLAITKRLVEKFNGTITLDSSVGKGSVFTVNIPDIEIVDEDQDQHSEIDAEIGNLEFEPAKIMIVDDVDYNIALLINLTANENFTFITASSGEKALEILKTEIPDIIFMDLRMTGISGYQVTEILKKNPKFNRVPIIAFTASAMTTSLPAIKALFDGYLRKPVNKKQIYYFLKKHLDYSVRVKISPVQLTAEKDQNLSEECKKRLPAMVQRLESEMMPQWFKVKDDLIIFEIQKFVKQCSELIQDYPCQIMQTYVNALNESIDSFDIDSIETLLPKFPEEIGNVKKILQDNNLTV
ncbi:MAG: ATP-binding protein, partial [Bacteroidales bacterium]|nr:ATP-binding protein [Bacteroidales bacterium]